MERARGFEPRPQRWQPQAARRDIRRSTSRRNRWLRAPATNVAASSDSILAVGEGTLCADKCPETVVHGFGTARKVRKMAINQRKLLVGLGCAHPLPGKTV